jgi:hypothetical protein
VCCARVSPWTDPALDLVVLMFCEVSSKEIGGEKRKKGSSTRDWSSTFDVT